MLMKVHKPLIFQYQIGALRHTNKRLKTSSHVTLFSTSSIPSSIWNKEKETKIKHIPNNYSTLLKELYQINMYHPVKLGLQNMERLYSLLDRPLDDIPVVHITGTNGKGSVALKIARYLSAHDIKTGLFVSPHIASFRERIQIDSSLITEQDVEDFLPHIMRLCIEHDIPATFFEVTTALAFMCYRKYNVEALVLEVGLGGRLDATNVIPSPVLAIMTSIQLDHQKILGATRELIAQEKVGIVKAGTTVLIGPETPTYIVRTHSDKVNAGPLYTLSDFFPSVAAASSSLIPSISQRTGSNLFDLTKMSQSPTFGYADTDHLNTDLARAAIHILKHASLVTKTDHGADDTRLTKKQLFFQQRLQSASIAYTNGRASTVDEERALQSRPPCRFEQYTLTSFVSSDGTQLVRADSKEEIRVILDIAHNIQAMEALVQRMQMFYPSHDVRAVLGMSADKDISDCVQLVSKLVEQQVQTHLYCTQAEHPRALGFLELRRLLDVNSAHRLSSLKSKDGDIRTALTSAICDSLWTPNTISNTSISNLSHAKIQVAPYYPNRECSKTETSSNKPKLIVVCGTAFIMAEVRSVLGLQEPRDSVLFQATYSFSNNGKSDGNDDKLSKRFRDIQEHFAPNSTSNKYE